MIQRLLWHSIAFKCSRQAYSNVSNIYLKIGLDGDVGGAVGDQEPHVLVLD